MMIRFIAAALLLFFSKTALCQREVYRAAKENDSEIFIITGDSIKHTGTKIKFPNTYPAPYIKLDGVKYSRKKEGILAYQTEDVYMIWVPSIGDASRYLKGKINLYFYPVTLFDGHAEIVQRICLEKDKGIFKVATFENIENLLGDNPEVMAKYREFFPHIKNRTTYFFSNRNKDESDFRDHVIELVKMYNR